MYFHYENESNNTFFSDFRTNYCSSSDSNRKDHLYFVPHIFVNIFLQLNLEQLQFFKCVTISVFFKIIETN